LLYLVRHGEADRSLPESPGTGLSALGERQAHLLAERLAAVPFDVVRHSPLRRAEETAQILASYLPAVPVQSSELLRDRTPVPSADQLSRVPPQYHSFLHAVPAQEADPGAVQLSEAVARLAVCGQADRHELLVTHNFVIGWFVRHAMDAPDWRWIGLNQFNCGLTIIQISASDRPMLITFNDIGHLPLSARGHVPADLRS
jgi:serine/threonine-protein phosphatase PGAM5